MLTQPATAIARTARFPVSVGQFMRWPAPLVRPETSVREAVDRLSEHAADHAVAVSHGRVCGLVCELDLVDLDDGDPLWWAMTPPAGIVVPSTAVDDAAALLLSNGSCAAVVDTGDDYGVLTRDDIAAAGFDWLLLCALCGTAHRVSSGADGEPAFCCECAVLLVLRDNLLFAKREEVTIER